MLQFFESIADFLATAWQMVINFFSSLVTAIDVVTNAALMPHFILFYVPSFIGSCILMVLSIGVIKLLVGWGNK